MAGRGVPPTALAALVHDAGGHLLAPLSRAGEDLRRLFAGIALGVTEATSPQVVAALSSLGARIRRHPVGEEIIGRARRETVELAIGFGTPRVVYADFDAMLRWLEGSPDEIVAMLLAQPAAAMLIVGRSARAFAAEPERLRRTEVVINRTYELLTGRPADLLAAIRRMDRATAADIVARSAVDTLANDVEWPLLAESLGHSVGYAEAEGLHYRTMEQYGAIVDGLDADPLQWIRRIEFAGEQARAMRPYLQPPLIDPGPDGS